MRPKMSALLLSIVFLIPHFALAGHPPCLHSQEVSELASIANPVERLNLLRIYSRIAVGRLVVEVANYRPMREEGYSVPIEIAHPEREELKRFEFPNSKWEEVEWMLRYRDAVKSSYWCVMVPSIHEVRELEDVQGEARCLLEDMHSETQSFIPRIRTARKYVEVYKELHHKVDSAIEVTEDLAAEIRDARARGAHPTTGG